MLLQLSYFSWIDPAALTMLGVLASSALKEPVLSLFPTALGTMDHLGPPLGCPGPVTRAPELPQDVSWGLSEGRVTHPSSRCTHIHLPSQNCLPAAGSAQGTSELWKTRKEKQS